MKPRNLVIWAGLTCACLIAFFSCAPLSNVARFVGLGQEKVKVTPEEFQRLVYSSHVLTIIDDKPELEGALLALRELHRENRQASPTGLVTPVRWALEEYRKEASSRTLPVTWRDEILGRYFLKLCEAPGLAEPNTVALNLLKVLLAQQDTKELLGEQAGRFDAGSQRLLAVANGPGERQALVESCTRRAQSDPNFAAAMDALLLTEIGIAHDALPADIFAKNEALAQSPTMQELMRLSSSSEDGSVVITMDKLKGLFVAEVAVAREAVTTHQALDREIGRAQEDLVKYPDNATRLAEMIKRHVDEQARQRGRIAASSAAAKELSGMALEPAPQDAKKLDTVSKTLGLVGSSLSQFGAYATNPVGAVGGVFSLAGAGCQFSTLFMDQGPPPEETILKSVQLVGTMITDLSVQMEDRFDRVDRSLVYILRDLRSVVLLVGQVGHDVDQVRGDLLEAQASLNRLERELGSYLNAGFGRELVKHINGDLGFEARTGEPMSWEWYRATDGPENEFHTWAVHNAKDELASPMPADADLADIHLLGQLESRPLERNLNYIKEFLRQRLGVSSLPEGPVASLGDWYAGANAYLRLAAENPQHFRRIDPKRLEEVIQAGTELDDFFCATTFVKSGPGAKVNRELYDAVLSYYEEKLGAFNTAVSKVENDYGRDWLNGFDVPMWRQWEARAPRLTVADTAVSGKYYLRRIPTDVVGVATSEGHSLAIRANGTVVAWGNNWNGQCNVPADLNDVIAVSAGLNHSLALKRDGTIVAWGDNRFGQCDIPEHKEVTEIAAGAYHSLALQADGRVIAWGRASNGACDVPDKLTDVVDIAACGEEELGDISLALEDNGTVMAWGKWAGVNSKVPSGLSNIETIAVRYGLAAAVKGDGTVVGWSMDPEVSSPRLRDGVTDVAAVALGEYRTWALGRDGTVKVVAGSLEGTPQTDSFVAIAAARRHALALRDDGTLIAWGYDDARWGGGVPGDSTKAVVGMAGSDSQHLLHIEDGRVTSLGIDIPLDLGPVMAIAVGETECYGEIGFCLALKADGTVVAWGDKRDGWCNVPKGLSDVVAIAIGDAGCRPLEPEAHCLALTADGTVVAWGDNTKGQCNVPENLDDAVAIAAGWCHSLALRANGTVVAWGSNLYKACNVPDNLDKVVAIAARAYHNLALKADGTVVAWGDNTKGQCNVPKGLAGVVAIAAGEGRSLALKADGTVVAWGHNDQGECDFAAAQTGVLAMASGGYFRDSFLVSPITPSIENTEPLPFVRGEPPAAVMYRLRALCAHLPNEFDRDLNDSLNELVGAKVLLESVIALGMPDSLDQDDVLRGFLFGSESLIDRDSARTLYQAEMVRLNTDEWRRRASTLEETPKTRLEDFRRRLNERFDALEQSGTPEIPRMVAYTLLQLRLLRAAY